MADDNAGLPAAKLQKPAAGDVTIGTSMQAVTEPLQADAAAVLPIESSLQHATFADANKSVVDGPTGGKKRKVALYVAYIGAGYYGMQRNPGYPSIEGELEKAICKAGGISAANADSFSKVGWMRAARTDKGVSAVGQLVSLKMLVEFPNYDVIANINKHLPDQIRVLGYTKVTGGFDARKHCDKRRYEYVLPAWAFDPNACRSRISAEEAELASAAHHDSSADADSALPGPPPRHPSAPSPNPNPSTASHTDAQLASTAADAAAETTAAAVASDAVTPSIPDSSLNGCHTHALQPNPSPHSLDLPQPSPAEAVPAALPRAAHTAQTRPQQQQPSEANTEAETSGQAAHAAQGGAANRPADISADALSSATNPSAPEPSDAEVSDAMPQAARPMSSEAAPSTNSPSAALPPAAAAASPAADAASSAAGGASSAADAASPAAAAEPMKGHAASGSDFTFDAAAVARLTSILQQYEGTHNFHNFTVRLEATDPSAKRYMLSCKCDGVFQIQGEPWVRIVIIGQSFMLHQIRKMVGMAVAIMRGDAAMSCIKLAFRPDRLLPTPMAPDVGLFLDECYFGAYNKRWGKDHDHVTLSQFADRVAEFKAQLMYPHIATTDAAANTNATWLRSISERSFHFSKWSDVKACRAVFGQRGERAIFNGDVLPAPAGAASIVGGHENYGLGGRGRGRGPREPVSVGEKRSRPLEKPSSVANGNSAASIVDISLQLEYSD